MSDRSSAGFLKQSMGSCRASAHRKIIRATTCRPVLVLAHTWLARTHTDEALRTGYAPHKAIANVLWRWTKARHCSLSVAIGFLHLPGHFWPAVVHCEILAFAVGQRPDSSAGPQYPVLNFEDVEAHSLSHKISGALAIRVRPIPR